MKQKLLLLIVWVTGQTTCFIVPFRYDRSNTFATSKKQQQPLNVISNGEKELRDAIAQRNSQITDEAKYAVVDGSGLETILDTTDQDDTSSTVVRTVNRREITAEAIQALATKTRAYPLFLLEKAVEILEGILDETTELARSIGILTPTEETTLKKERLVVLGTGWGGISLLKEIDTSKFDVTVISPKNHFVFTPMVCMYACRTT